jgi:hypothetical protein
VNRLTQRIVQATANLGYGLTVMSTLFLGNIGMLLIGLPHPESAAMGHLMDVLAFAILGSLALILTGISLNRARPLTDRSAMLWIWLLSLPVSRRLAELALSVRWEESMVLEAALLSAAVVMVVVGAGRMAPEKAP